MALYSALHYKVHRAVKTAEPIEMPVVICTRGLKEACIDWDWGCTLTPPSE